MLLLLLQINLPQSVCGRQLHSVSSIRMNTNTQWMIVTGGYGMDCSLIVGVDVVMIIEIGMCIIITHDNSCSILLYHQQYILPRGKALQLPTQ